MHTRIASLLILFSMWLPLQLAAQTIDRPRIYNPKDGDALQGVVTISGNTNVSKFKSAEVSFTYNQDDSTTWFLIQQSQEPVEDGPIATWDTTTITDGSYRLRVRVTRDDGSHVETVIGDLRVRNYTPVETNTPAATEVVANLTEVPLETASTAQPTATRLPDNPAKVTSGGLWVSFLRGMAVVFVGFVVIGIYLGLRALTGHK